jgi:hypothetical protein
LSSRTHARLEGTQADVNYRSLVFDNVNLRAALNRRGREARLSLRHATTTLTTFVLTGEYLEDHFEFTPDRNSIGVRVMPGLEFNRFAIISGRASVGWREFRPESPLVPDYSGPAARVELSTVVGDRLRVDASVDRDVTYSYSAIYPYYLQNLTYASATLRISRRWDLVLRGGEQRLSYRVLGAEPPLTDEPDELSGTYYGAILGFRLRRDVRLALTGTQARRRGGPLDRSYDTWQVGGSIGYGY